MTAPQPQPVPPADPANRLLAEQPAELATALVQTPQGQRLLLTIRTPSATLTVFLQGADAKNWAAMLRQAADAMSGAGLIVANGNVR